MRKLKLQVRISFNGYVDSDTLLLCRKMSESFSYHFEAMKPDNLKYTYTQKIAKIRKFIFSKILDKPTGKNVLLGKENLSDEIAKLKNRNGKDMLVHGGAGSVSSLNAGWHIDEFLFLVLPVMIKKMRIFDRVESCRQLMELQQKPN